ncbi:MAG: hypothetical protein ACO3GL_00865 [Bacteroidia bacterium]
MPIQPVRPHSASSKTGPKSLDVLALLVLVSVLFSHPVCAQFEEKSIQVGQMGLHLTNAGTIGRPNVRNEPQGLPSMEYPLNSGVEHLFEAGLWLGAYRGGQLSVSTGSLDDASGYAAGKAGFEFSPLPGWPVLEKSSLPGNPNYSLSALAHQEFELHFTDSLTYVPGSGQPIANHLLPLNARVQLNSLAWNFPFADYFTVLRYRITNLGPLPWDSLYTGIWSDLVVRNVNVTNDRGGAFFNKGSVGAEDSLQAIYAFHVTGDDAGFANSYGAIQFLGAEFNGTFYHPNSAASPDFKVHPNYWIYNQAAPTSDLQRYDRLKNRGNFGPSANLNVPGNRVQLLGSGPFARIDSGQSLDYYVAFVCAPRRPDQVPDSYASRTDLRNNLGWAQRTFMGEDTNANGVLDTGEDLNGNGLLDRFVLPEPPTQPKMRAEFTNEGLDIYWDNQAEKSIDPITKVQDFEGYRLYLSKPGDDRYPDAASRMNLIAQWDSAGNSLGYNNGFESVRLAEPVQFEGDTVLYKYRHRVGRLLPGWQYLCALTSFDRGNTAVGLESLESSRSSSLRRLFPGTPGQSDLQVPLEIGVYPNPYRLAAAWDGSNTRSRKMIFYNLPPRCQITIFTLAGDPVATLQHQADQNFNGSQAQWFGDFAGNPDQTVMAGGEHAWDILSDSKQSIQAGIYLFNVTDLDSDRVYNGKFVVLR